MYESKKDISTESNIYEGTSYELVKKQVEDRCIMSVKNTEVMEVIDLLKQQYTRRRKKESGTRCIMERRWGAHLPFRGR